MTSPNALPTEPTKYLAMSLITSNECLLKKLSKAATTHEYDYISPYVADLANVVDMEMIAASGLKLGVDPMGGAAVHYWAPIAERYGLSLDIVNPDVDPTFAFMTLDKDGKIRMDCSSPFAMQGLIKLKDKFDIAFGNDTDGRSPRDCHQKRRTAQSESFSDRGHMVSVSKPTRLESTDCRGQNAGVHLDDRPGGGTSWEKAV